MEAITITSGLGNNNKATVVWVKKQWVGSARVAPGWD